MLKKIFTVCVFALILNACQKKDYSLVIWTYDSFISEWGPSAAIEQNWLEAGGRPIRWESEGDAGSLVSRILLEGNGASADIVLGFDQNLLPRLIESGLLESYKPVGAENIIQVLEQHDFLAIPYDYSYFSIIYDSEKISSPPQSLDELLDERFKNQLIIMDPRTSSPGLGFLSWTIAQYGGGWQQYWQALRPQLLTIAAGWDEGYGLFTKGEAPLVLSYTTSPAYHLEYENSERYRAALFKSGHPIQCEYAGLLANAANKTEAKKFLDFMLSSGFQNAIPLGNWMYPVVEAALPPSFNAAPKPNNILKTQPVTENQIEEWSAIFR